MADKVTWTVQQIKAAASAVGDYIEYHGGVHDEDCPEDDTCDCSGERMNAGANVSIAMLLAFARQTRQVEQQTPRLCLTCKWAGDVVATGVDFPEQECNNPKFGGGYWAMPCGIGCTAHEPREEGGQ